MFAVSYHYDKLLATLVDRPPRLSKRFFDCRMPLDINNHELLTEDPLETMRIQQSLTSDGWNPNSKYSCATWARLRFMVASLREDVLEYSFQPLTTDSVANLKCVGVILLPILIAIYANSTL